MLGMCVCLTISTCNSGTLEGYDKAVLIDADIIAWCG